jgi:hypothetical protein
MTRPIKKWPTYALDSLENAVYGLKNIDELARQVQEALVSGDSNRAIICAGDIRSKALDAKAGLLQARIGDYKA